MNEKVRFRVQAAEMGFLRRISGLTLLDKVKSAGIRESLNIELLLLRLERPQLCWYGHVTRTFQERTAKSEITLKILVGLALAFQQSTYSWLQRIEMLEGSNSSC